MTVDRTIVLDLVACLDILGMQNSKNGSLWIELWKEEGNKLIARIFSRNVFIGETTTTHVPSPNLVLMYMACRVLLTKEYLSINVYLQQTMVIFLKALNP